MSDSGHDVPAAGRPVRLVPTRRGFWRLVLGICLATFAPLFGFLAGSMTGSSGPAAEMTAPYWGLLVGFGLGALGLIVAFLGGRQLWLGRHHSAQQEVTS